MKRLPWGGFVKTSASIFPPIQLCHLQKNTYNFNVQYALSFSCMTSVHYFSLSSPSYYPNNIHYLLILYLLVPPKIFLSRYNLVDSHSRRQPQPHSVELLVFNFCFVLIARRGTPIPKDIHAPVWLFISGWTAYVASTHVLIICSRLSTPTILIMSSREPLR